MVEYVKRRPPANAREPGGTKATLLALEQIECDDSGSSASDPVQDNHRLRLCSYWKSSSESRSFISLKPSPSGHMSRWAVLLHFSISKIFLL
jgi:hypothetical protein